MNRLAALLAVLAMLASSVPSDALDPLDGVWRSQGYGYFYDIRGSTLKAFEVTRTTCLLGFTAHRQNAPTADHQAEFRTKEGDVYFVRTGGEPDHKLLHSEGAVSDIRMDRLAKMPEICSRLTQNTPEANFEVFSNTWAENYISFDLKHADWNTTVADARRQFTSATPASRLFEIFQSMIEPFGDAHTTINARNINRVFHGIRPGTDRVAKHGLRAFHGKEMHDLLSATDHAYIRGPLREFCNNQIEYGHINDNTGYLRLWSFSDYSKSGDFRAGEKALEAALDEIFADPKLAALIIDVRINFGGDDPYGIDIASRLANGEYVAYSKYARADPVDHNKWTPGDESVVRPNSRPGFHGPVAELIGPLTISAGETFTQALLGRTPHVTRIGENTQGVFSDVLVRSLPNGWHFGLPNEVYRTPQGLAFDGTGIPPDIVVPVFADADVASGKDPAMAKALEILR